MRKVVMYSVTFLLLGLSSSSFGEIRQLTNFNAPFNMNYVTLSGDGKYVYFISSNDLDVCKNANKYSQLFKLDTSSKIIMQISNFTTERYLSYLRVSGNGLKMVFYGSTENQPLKGAVFVMDTSGDNLHLVSLVEDTISNVIPSISWDGEWILYGVAPSNLLLAGQLTIPKTGWDEQVGILIAEP